MKRVALLAMIAMFFCGCFATVSVNPETGLVKYMRLGGQEISGLRVTKSDNNITVKLDSAKSDPGAETITAVNELLESVNAIAK
jgi:PBP1b-binding outer membrane lipoprotein LpoB